jgi:hypothetical protein
MCEPVAFVILGMITIFLVLLVILVLKSRI